jgi:hypothetical protein
LPAFVAVLNDTVASPFASVVLVEVVNDPPVPVLLHVTTLPDVLTALLLASTNCAVIGTALPATGFGIPAVTIYFAAVPGIVVMFPLVPVSDCASVPVTV